MIPIILFETAVLIKFQFDLYLYSYKLKHFGNKLQNACTRVTTYTFGISTREMKSVSYSLILTDK